MSYDERIRELEEENASLKRQIAAALVHLHEASNALDRLEAIAVERGGAYRRLYDRLGPSVVVYPYSGRTHKQPLDRDEEWQTWRTDD